MAIIGKILSQGYLSSSLSPIYTAPLTTTYVKFFSLYNEAFPATQSVLLYASGSGSSIFGRVELNTYESALVIAKDETITLRTGESIYAITTNDSSVAYTLSGGEE